MSKRVTLKDGSSVLIRPLGLEDSERSLTFFRALPEEDRIYLRTDVTKPENIERRFRRMEYGELRCLVAVADDAIVADGALELEGRDWKTHLAEMRMFVSSDFRRKGLGVLITRELHALAMDLGVEEIMVRMMRPQLAARSVVRRLGFKQDAVLTDYVRDMEGEKQDLIVMRCEIAALWREMEEYLADSDWQRTR